MENDSESIMKELDYIAELVNRSQKPRKTGLTMVIDKNLGPSGALDLVRTGCDYIDIVKLGWATWTLSDFNLVKEKVAIYRNANINVCPGGTSLEIAYQRGKLEHFLDLIGELGFNGIEVSDGSIDLSSKEKSKIIQKAREKFYVVSEVGKKNPELDHSIKIADRIEMIKQDLNAGATKVIIEAREGGKDLGIFDGAGHVKSAEVSQIVEEIGLDKLIFEAPHKNQQVWFIKNYGPNVNLGNIAVTDLIPLETLRMGIRGDTFGLNWKA